MIYLDNAATTWPKPLSVRKSMAEALWQYGANPGRGGHDFGMRTAEQVFRCREIAAGMFGLDNPAHVIFTANCTMSLNVIIGSLAKRGGHVIISDLEHNAVLRTLHAYTKQYRLSYDIASIDLQDVENTVQSFERLIRPSTRAIICTQASNVFGVAPPIRQIGEMAHRHGLLMIVDGAQGAGIFRTDLVRDHIDFYCAPGHKGLYGPMGTGLLLCNSDFPLHPLCFGGTGTNSVDKNQPDQLPERIESGTLNVVGICGLCAGIESVLQKGVENIARYERELLRPLYQALSACEGVDLYSDWQDIACGAPVLSFNFKQRHSEEGAALLNRYQIACRAGLHCAPLAHQKYRTLDTGTIRLSPSKHTTPQEMKIVEKVIKKYAKT